MGLVDFSQGFHLTSIVQLRLDVLGQKDTQCPALLAREWHHCAFDVPDIANKRIHQRQSRNNW